MCLCTGMVCHPDKTGKLAVEKNGEAGSWNRFRKFLKNQSNRIPLKNSLYPKISKILHK